MSYAVKAFKGALVDGEVRNREHPETFEIPAADARTSLPLGVYAKVSIERADEIGERFWVRVEDRYADGAYVGRICNDLVIVEDVACGDMIRFEPRHVLGVTTETL